MTKPDIKEWEKALGDLNATVGLPRTSSLADLLSLLIDSEPAREQIRKALNDPD